MNKKIMALGIVGTLGLAGVILVPLAVSAATTTTNTTVSEFVQQLAAKLGIDQGTVQTAVDSVKTDMKATRDAQVKADIATAVTNSKLTQRQADLLIAQMGVQLDPPTKDTQVDPSTLTEAQRQAQMQANRTAREQAMVDKLNASGLNTTVDELKAAEDAARTAGIRMMGGRGEFGGHGFGMMR